MKTKKRQWLFGFGMVVLMLISSLSIPALAEQMIASAENNVQVDEAIEAREEMVAKDTTKAAPLKGHPLSDEAFAKLTEAGREAFRDVFALEIPADYQPVRTEAYESSEEEGVITYILSLMPPNWEESMDVMAASEAKPFYTAQFLHVDVNTGEAALAGLQQWMQVIAEDRSSEEDQYPGAVYSDSKLAEMEEHARAFAAGLNYEVLDVIAVDNVSGGYPQGCILMFSMEGEKTLSVTVSEQGEISGYSLVPGKG